MFRSVLVTYLLVLSAGPGYAADGDRSDTPMTPAALDAQPTGAVPPLPEALASFGAAVEGDWLYVYGGHVGRKHEHSTSNQAGAFRRIHLSEGRVWESLPGGQPLQSVALVAHDGALYRVGGMQARNAEGEPEVLYSTDEFARFDPGSLSWETLPCLPEKRSSHDAVVIDGRLFVAGGWTLAGDPQQAVWLTTVWSFDLSDRRGNWKRHADAPFLRRALSLATAGHHVIALGGLSEQGKRAGEAFRYEPASDRWSSAPSLPGDGFGMSSIGRGEAVYAAGEDGAVLILEPDSESWEEVARLKEGRMFLRLLGHGDSLLALGGANHRGHLRSIERITLPADRGAGQRSAVAVNP